MYTPSNSDGDDLRWNSNPNPCQLANVTCKTRGKGQKEKSRISCGSRGKETLTVGEFLSGRSFLIVATTWCFGFSLLLLIPFVPAHKAALMRKNWFELSSSFSRFVDFTAQFCFRCKFSFRETQASSQFWQYGVSWTNHSALPRTVTDEIAQFFFS